MSHLLSLLQKPHTLFFKHSCTHILFKVRRLKKNKKILSFLTICARSIWIFTVTLRNQAFIVCLSLKWIGPDFDPSTPTISKESSLEKAKGESFCFERRKFAITIRSAWKAVSFQDQDDMWSINYKEWTDKCKPFFLFLHSVKWNILVKKKKKTQHILSEAILSLIEVKQMTS